MDKFQEIMKMSKDEWWTAMKEKESMCICRDCPSYKIFGSGITGFVRELRHAEGREEVIELLFCAVGKSTKINEAKGCICSRCPVNEQMELKHTYFCIRDAEPQQRGLESAWDTIFDLKPE